MTTAHALHLLHTNDVHSELQAYCRLATSMRQRRQQLQAQGAAVLCFDIGDHVDIAHPISAASGGQVNVEMMQALGYDGWVWGNNESLMLTSDQLKALGARPDGPPVLCANVEGAASHRLFDIDGITVGVFGITVYYPKLHDCLGVSMTDPVAAAWRQAQSMRALGADVVIMLSHLGLAADEALAEQGLPVDVILGGHSHHFLAQAQKRGRTWICQAGKYAQAFGHTVLHLTKGPSANVADVWCELVYSTPADSVDRAVVAAYEKGANAARAWLDEQVCDVSEPIAHSLLGESTLVNILCDELRLQTQSDLALVNGGVIAGCLRSGQVTRQTLLTNCPTPMRAVITELSGREIIHLLAEARRTDLAARQGFGYGFRGYLIGLLHVSGGIVYTDTSQGVEAVVVAGEPLQLAQIYRVAICEFVALSHVRTLFGELSYAYYPVMLRDVYASGLAKKQAVAAGKVARYRAYTGG